MNWTGIINLTLLLSTVLSLGALSGYFSERVGIANISIDGQMIFAALSFCIFGELLYPRVGDGGFIIPMLLAMIMTLIASSLFGFLTITLKANQIVAGTAINLTFLGLGTFLTEPLGSLLTNGQHTKLQSNFSQLGLIDGTNIFIGSIFIFIIVIIIISGLFVLMKYTPFGLRLRAIGNNPNAVDAQGISVIKYQWYAISISGLLAGLAGALYMYNLGGVFGGNVNGFGFLSLAILIAGSWKIPMVAAVAILFAFITKLFDQLTVQSSLDKDVAKIVPYAITLGAMILFSKYNIAPKNIGIPFDKSKR